MKTDFINEEYIDNNLAALDSSLSNGTIKLEDYLKIAMLVKVYETLQEIKESIKK